MAGNWRRATVVVLAALMVYPLGAFLGTETRAREVTSFSGGAPEFSVDVVPPGTVAPNSLVLPEYSYVVNSSFRVSTHAGGDLRAPANLSLDLDADSVVDWAFDGTGAGAFGRQDRDVNGSAAITLRYAAAGNQSFTLRLPRGAAVSNATLNISGILQDITFKPAKLTGAAAYEYFGMSVAGAVDLNRDGYDDVVVGAPAADVRGFTDNGYANIYFGGPDGPASAASDSLSGADNGDAFGFSVAGVRDFNGDGYGEVLGGAPFATQKLSVTPRTGLAYLYAYDSSTGRFRKLPGLIIAGTSEGGQMGYSVAEIGDIDGDGRADIAAGEVLANKTFLQPYVGRVAAQKSSDATSTPENRWGDSAYSLFGCTLVWARDLDGDRKADFVVGGRFNTLNGPFGAAYVYLSRGGFKNPLVFQGTQLLSNFSASVATGDFNGDGFEDLAVGAPNQTFGGKMPGAVFIYSGSATGPDPSGKPVLLQGRQDGGGYGYSLACPGDLDGDGTDDLLVGIPKLIPDAGVAPVGAVDLVFTGRSGANGTRTFWGDLPNENFGLSLAAAGDVNRDGFRDFIVGAPTFPTAIDNAVGRAVVFMSQMMAPRNPRINVGGSGADDWSSQGSFARDVRIPDFSKKLNGILSNPLPVVTDDYGNEFNDIPVTVYCGGPGLLVIHKISIVYNWTATVDLNPDPGTGNLTWVLNQKLSHKQQDISDRAFPLLFNATSPGRVRVHDLHVLLDEPPVAGTAPALSIPEDGSDAYLLDLYTLFSDDFQAQPDLLFWIDGCSNDTIATVTLTDWRYLSVDLLNGTANDNWTGEVRVEVSAQDDSWLVNWTNITITVTPVNDPPEITSLPATLATAGAPYSYRMAARDAEGDPVGFGLVSGPEGMTVNASSGEVRWIPNEGQFNQSHDITTFAGDGRLCATQSWSVNVSSRLDGVSLGGTPPPTAVVGEEYLFRPEAATDVSNTTVTFSLRGGPAGMTVQPDGTVRWVPSASQAGTAEVTVEATDGYFTARKSWQVSVFSAGTPLSGLRCAIGEPADGSNVSGKVVVRGSSSITFGGVLRVDVRIDQKEWTAAEGALDWSFELDTTRLSNGRHVIYARAWDGENFSQNTSITLEVRNAAAAGAGLSGTLMWGLLALAALLAVAVPAGVLLLRRKRAAPRAPPAAPARTGEEIAVEDVFLIHLDGRLIHHATRRLATGVDSDILSSMLTAVTSFVKDALVRTSDGQLGSLEYGENKILLERGKWTYVAVVITGTQEPPELRGEMRQVLRNVEAEYSSVLPGWDGNSVTLSGVKRLLGPLTAFSAAQAAPAAQPAGVEVGVSSELEFYQGYVRLKIAVKNSSPAFIMDSALRVIYNDKALRLDHIEPEYPAQGREIMLGNIGIREKKTVALYLDPQICMESHIDGTLTFKDAQGEMHHADMKRKLASVVCPIMHTDENVNVPMLRRLLESELDQKDTKVFSLPSDLTSERAFELCKRAVQGHDIRLVREFSDRDPYVGEAWYYGMVKGREDRLVVKTAVRADTGSAEFYVASNSRLVVTGLLAELKNDLNKEYRKEKGSDRSMEALADQSRREKVRSAGSLLDKYAQSEAEAGTAGAPKLKN